MASYSNSRSHILAMMNSGSARAGRWNFLFCHVFYRVHSSFRSFDNYWSYQMDCWGAFECTRLVETVLHLKTVSIGPQENYTVDNFVCCWAAFWACRVILLCSHNRIGGLWCSDRIWPRTPTHDLLCTINSVTMTLYPAHLPIFSCLNQCWVCWASWWNIFLSVFCIQFLFS